MKVTITTINCDTCLMDISPHDTCYPRADILQVSCVNTAINPGIIYPIHQRPLIEKDLYFCSIKCMKEFGLNKDDV